MRFKFCGDLDCPDWILAEIATLSRVTSVKIKLLSIHVLKNLLGENIDYEKVYKLTADAKYDTKDVKATIAALSFILTSATKHSVEEETLLNELQQLGLPKEHSISICKAYADNFKGLQTLLRKKSLRFSFLEDLQWRVEYVISSSHMKDVNQPMVNLLMKIGNNSENKSTVETFSLTEDKFRVLLYELKQAYSIMEGLTTPQLI